MNKSKLRGWLDSKHPLFVKGGELERFYPVYEMIDTFLYSPPDVTARAPHVRDALDLKRVMTYVVLATIPAILFGCWNTGYQANLALTSLGLEAEGWRAAIISALGIGFNPDNAFANFFHGFLYFLPIYIATLVAGGTAEVIFAIIRGHDVNEGFFVTSMLYALILPATTPLWQVALGIIFGVVIGKEIFGGTGKNFLNPALVGRAFLYFSFPAYQSGDSVWTPVDGYSAATPLGIAAADGVEGINNAGITWMDAFVGTIQGCVGSTSTLAILIGMCFILFTGVANYRLIAGTFVGMIATSFLFNLVGSPTNPMFEMPWYWHMVLGGFAFGAVFMVTDPVSAAQTNAGRWMFGILAGAMTVLIRVVNPAYPEGIMLAILFANLFAPLFDHFVMQANIKRRGQRQLQAA